MSKPSKWLKKLLRRHRRKSVSPNKPPSPVPATGIGNGNGNASNVTAIASSYGETDLHVGDPNKRAIAVAAATAAVAEAALAAARAAAEVVRLTSSSNNVKSVSRHVSRRWSYDELAAVVKIQSVFRGYLARKALKALRGLVKLQALVRGHFVRKQSADMLRRLQAMVRVQARARSNRVINIESSICSTGKETPRSNQLCNSTSSEKLEESPVLKRCGSNTSVEDSKASEKTISATNWLDNWVEVGSSINNSKLTKTPNTDDEKNDKILEVDSWKPNSIPKSRNPNNHISTKDYYNHSFGASDYIAKYSPNRLHKPNVSAFAEDNASLKSGASRTGSMRRSPKTPSREECSRSYLNGYATFASPSYMANTQSSRARARSLSVPRQRQDDSEKLSSVKRSLQAFWESKTSSKKSLESYSNLSQQRW